jgi:toxin FitB
MERNSGDLYLSVVTVAEVEDGIAKAARDGAGQKAKRLADWLETVLHLYSARILDVDIPTARLAGQLSDLARGRGHAPGFADLLIAATAQRRTYVVLTRNLRHFTPMDVAAHDPFAGLP